MAERLNESAAAGDGDYPHVLAAWTEAVTATLEPGARTLFWFLCCLEEPDRERPVVDDNWAGLWSRLELDGQPPALDQALTAVVARGLVAVQPETASEHESYVIHPGVAATGRGQAGTPFRDAVDTEAAEYWGTMFWYASGEASGHTVHTRLLVRAGLAAVPYLMRRQQWSTAGTMLERAFVNDPSRANAAAMLPAIQEIVTHDARHGNGVSAPTPLAATSPATTRSRTSRASSATSRSSAGHRRCQGVAPRPRRGGTVLAPQRLHDRW